MQSFTETEVSWNRLGLDLQSMSEVLGGFLVIPSVSKQGGQVNSGTEVLLIHGQALLKHSDGWLVLP